MYRESFGNKPIDETEEDKHFEDKYFGDKTKVPGDRRDYDEEEKDIISAPYKTSYPEEEDQLVMNKLPSNKSKFQNFYFI